MAAAHNARVAGVPATAPPSREAQREAKLHEEIAAECRRRGWYCVHSRIDRPTTTALGVPDFICAADGGRTFWIEAKGAKTKVTLEQAGTLQWLRSLGHVAAVVRSLEEFLNLVDLPR